MKDHNSRDRPSGSLLDGLGILIIVLTVMAVIGIFSSLLQAMDFGVTDGGKDDQIFDNTADDDNTEEPPSIEEPPEEEPPEEDPPVEEPISDGRGTGVYSSSPGVFNFEVENDRISTAVTPLESNWSKQVMDGDNPCLEIFRADITQSTMNITKFNPVEHYKTGFVFETDLKWMGTSKEFINSVSEKWILKLEFYESPDRSVHIFGFVDEFGNLCLSSSASVNGNLITIPLDEWINICIVLGGGKIDFYLNNYLTSSADMGNFLTNHTRDYTDFEFVKLETRYYLKDIQLRLDNTYVSAIDY